MAKKSSRHSSVKTQRGGGGSSTSTCPSDKFSFASDCISWSTIISLLAILALIIICSMIYMDKSSPNKSKMIRNRINNPVNLKVNSPHDETESTSSNLLDPENDSYDIRARDPFYSENDGTGTVGSDRIKYDININIRDDKPAVPNINGIPYGGYQAAKDMERVINPILPPERSYENTYGLPVNFPSRGYTGNFQQLGILYKENISNPNMIPGNNSETNILPLFGRPTYNGSKRWSYYTLTDKNQFVKLPLVFKGRKCDIDQGCDEIMEGDSITVPPYNGEFKVQIYDYDKPRYIPYVL